MFLFVLVVCTLEGQSCFAFFDFHLEQWLFSACLRMCVDFLALEASGLGGVDRDTSLVAGT